MDRGGADWSEEEWLEEARRVRAALAALGEDAAECLPGEPADCGQSVQSPYASYCSWLKAAAQLCIERDVPEAEGRACSGVVYESHLLRIRPWLRPGPLGPVRSIKFAAI
ncbi:hypothetical protein [Streptomyces sp. NPDC005525]|uniref:hypothetical protein n=1 Tax=Streptomyces sp. NPDC005525 TaxID=3364720 RepID=UPI0036B65585